MPLIQDTETLTRHLGKGLIFPILLENGKAKTYSGSLLIRSSIRIILSWEFGIRFFVPEFGSKSHSLLGEPNDNILGSSITFFIKEALKKWETRIQIIDEKTVIETIYPDKVILRITYQIRNSPIEDSFTFPLYRNINY